jgi:hypothetical protein
MRISIKNFIHITGLSKQTILKRVEEGLIKSIRDKKGRIFIIVPDDVVEEQIDDKNIDKIESNTLQPSSSNLQEIHQLVGGFVTEYKQIVVDLKNLYEKSLTDKDEQIKDLKEIIKNFQNKKRGFLDRMFGE